MNKLFASITLCLLATGSYAQFYYKDILSNRQIITEMKVFKENKIHHIEIKSFEDNGEPSEGFFCERKISKDYRKAELFTRSDISGSSLFISVFNKEGQLIFTSDSSNIAVSHNDYSYDAQGRISNITSTVRSSDDDFMNEIAEEHIYSYNEQNIPIKMIRVKNRQDSIAILFSTDDHGNVSIEKDSKNGSKYYYYYDAKNRLTDIVHTNEYTTNMLPDYMFEYNGAGQLTQMTTIEEGGKNYFIWKYLYENGLRIKEKVYNKEKKLMGSVEYIYD